ncbi:aspartate/glutamate racemase family protein [bacterium]|nr:aspartate/glutamate racemase family protein [bacterium]
MPTLGLVHTVRRVIPGLADLVAELLPDVRQLHYLDESVLQDAIVLGGLSANIIRRVRQLVQLAAERSDVVLVTCSSIGPAADIAAGECYVPVLRIDRPMAEEAVQTAQRIGVIATLSSTLAPTVQLVRKCAEEAEREAEVVESLVEGAFAAASAGDQAEHDRRVLAGLEGLLGGDAPADVVLLAQASMAAVAAQLPADLQARVLSSPRGGIIRAGEVLKRVAHP